jgi:dGTPase
MSLDLSPYSGCLAHLCTSDEAARRRHHHDEDECLYSVLSPYDLDAKQKLLQSKCLRRLMGKPAVLHQPRNWHVRRRLTHCFDNANVATACARVLGLNESLAFAIALGHDAGHTPFAHSGEKFIRDITGKPFRHEKFGVIILQHLERKGLGLNLTFQVLDGILRHSRGKNMFSTDPEATPEANLIPFADSISYLFADANDLLFKANVEPAEKHPKIIQLLEWFGKNQRERVYRCVGAICRESAEHGEVFFRDSEEAHQLAALKTLMYEEFYEHLPREHVTNWLSRCLSKLRDMHLNADPATVLALMTDEEVIALADNDAIRSREDLSPLAIGELLNDSDAIAHLDFMNPDMGW